jgi:cytoskeleton protein RodZ
MARFPTDCALTRFHCAPIFSPEHLIDRMPPTPFGERLKRERELRGVSLDEVSVATRINPKYLTALEAEQWDQLPGGVFNRGFIRTIARYLGLSEDGLISEYALVTNDHPTVTVWVQDLERQPRRWVPTAVIVLVVALLAVSGWIASKRWGGVAHGDTKAERASLAAPVSIEPVEPVHMDSAQGDSSQAADAAAPVTPDSPAGGNAPGGNASAATSQATSDSSQATASVVPAAETSAPALEKLALRVDTARKARIRVVADGRLQFAGWVAAGETRDYSARQAFEISASDSSAVYLELNGKTMAPIGTPGRPGRATLTRNDLRDSSGGSH